MKDVGGSSPSICTSTLRMIIRVFWFSRHPPEDLEDRD